MSGSLSGPGRARLAPWAMFAAIVVIAFLVGGLVTGRLVETLVICGGFVDCSGIKDSYVDLNPAGGALSGIVAAAVLVTIGVLRQRGQR